MVSIEAIVKACGVEYIRAVNAYDIESLVEAIHLGVNHRGPAVIIAQGLCRMLEIKSIRAQGESLSCVAVDPELCVDCRLCIDRFGCPAMLVSKDKVAIYLADLSPLAVMMERLAWVPAYDVEPLETMEARRRIRQWALENEALLIFDHELQVPMGYLREVNGEFKVKP